MIQHIVISSGRTKKSMGTVAGAISVGIIMMPLFSVPPMENADSEISANISAYSMVRNGPTYRVNLTTTAGPA